MPAELKRGLGFRVAFVSRPPHERPKDPEHQMADASPKP